MSTKRTILGLYAGLEKISKGEGNLDDIVNDFRKFFVPQNPNKHRRLFYDDILQGKITDEHRGNDQQREEDNEINGDTLLFRAMSVQSDESSVEKLDEIKKLIVENCPKMIIFEKKNEKCRGITPLHVAIMKGDIELLKLMAEALDRTDDKTITKERIKSICAVGTVFQNTAMMAGTLLGVASLKFNKEIFRLVLENFASGLDDTNDKRDNIVHSLIKYAHVQPDKMNDALNMLQYIISCKFIRKKTDDTRKASDCSFITMGAEDMGKAKRNARKLLMMMNKEKLNPLQLAAKRQQYDFFEFIFQHEVYHSTVTSDGIYSEEVFDITEIETLPLAKEVHAIDEEHIKTEYHESVLEYLVHHQTNNAFRFAAFLPVRGVIKEKWKYYRWWFWGWFTIHFIFMIFLSVAAMRRSELSNKSKSDNCTGMLEYHVTKDTVITVVSVFGKFFVGSLTELSNKSKSENGEAIFEYLVTKDTFVTVVSVFGLFFGVFNVSLEIARVCYNRFQFKTSSSRLKRGKRYFTTPYSNFLFRIYFSVFHLLLFVDFPVAVVAARQGSVLEYHNQCLIFAVIIGWYLFMFFLQGFKPFSFFTVLIQRVIVDMLKFAFVMLIFLVAFSIAMFMIMQGADTEDDDFNHFGKTMVKMLTIMLGIGDLGILYKARQKVMAIIVFVLFVLFTTILLLNALIAMMSNSCTDLMTSTRGITATKMHCRLQKLSVILFLENYLPGCCCKEVGFIKRKLRYENNEWVSNTRRRFWSLSSLQEDEDKESENYSDPVHDVNEQSIFSLLKHHIIRENRDKKRKKKTKQQANASRTTDFNYTNELETQYTFEPEMQRRLDIAGTDRKPGNQVWPLSSS